MFTVKAGMKYLSSHCDTITRTLKHGLLFPILFPGKYLKKLTNSNCWNDKNILEVSAFVIKWKKCFLLCSKQHLISLKDKMTHIVYTQIYLQLRDWSWCVMTEVLHYCKYAQSIPQEAQDREKVRVYSVWRNCPVHWNKFLFSIMHSRINVPICYSYQKRWPHGDSIIVFWILWWI